MTVLFMMEQGLCHSRLFSNALISRDMFVRGNASRGVESSLKDTGSIQKLTGWCFDYFQES